MRGEGFDSAAAAAAAEVVVEKMRIVNCVERRLKEEATAFAIMDLSENEGK